MMLPSTSNPNKNLPKPVLASLFYENLQAINEHFRLPRQIENNGQITRWKLKHFGSIVFDWKKDKRGNTDENPGPYWFDILGSGE